MSHCINPVANGSTLIECMFVNHMVLAADAGGAAALTQFIALFVPLFLIWYLLVIRPQQRQRRKLQDMLSNLKTGDRVITTGGIYGTIVGFRGESVVQLQVANQVKLEVARSGISSLQPPEAEESPKREAAGKAHK
jgi:preprotein translocase subunit YajC